MQLISCHARLFQGLINCGVHRSLVSFHCQLWHHASPGRMDVCLGEEGFAQDAPILCGQDRNARIVAAALDPENKILVSCSSGRVEW